MRSQATLLLASVWLFALLLLPGCAPRQIGASAHGFYGTGLASFAVDVAPPFKPVATGKLSARAASDVSLAATTRFTYALFAETETGPVNRHAHVAFGELPRESWRWEMETWGKPEGLLYTSMRSGGKNWTIQMFPVTAAGDWFSDLWLANGREIPEFWLAKRWSATPEGEMRILAEYREPAPACMRQRLAEAANADRNARPLDGKELWRNCDTEIEAFNARADGVFVMNKLTERPEAPLVKTVVLPAKGPNIVKLMGRAEIVDSYSRRIP